MLYFSDFRSFETLAEYSVLRDGRRLAVEACGGAERAEAEELLGREGGAAVVEGADRGGGLAALAAAVFGLEKALDRLNIPRGISGQMDCPICGGKGTVSYYKVPYNGHIHAECTGCQIRMMQ